MSLQPLPVSAPVDWPPAGGETAALLRARDWSATPLGPPAAWPQRLRWAVEMLLESPVAMVLLWGEQGVMIYNDAYSVFAGARHPQLFGSPVLEGWTEVADFNRHVMEEVRGKGRTLSFKDQQLTLHRYGRPETAWMNLDYSPLRDDAGRPEGVLAIVVETTERFVAEQRLRAANERIQLALDAGAVLGTWNWDIPQDCFTADERFARAFGLDGQRAVEGAPLDAVMTAIHPDDRPAVADLIRLTLQRGGPYATEYRVRRPDGGWRWVEANGHCELDGHGQPLRFPGVLIDAQTRREAARLQAALLALSDRLRELVQPEAIAREASERLGRTLQADRAGFMRVDGGWASSAGDWTTDGVEPITGPHALAHYGSHAADLQAGRVVVIRDVASDPRTAAHAVRWQALRIGAVIAVPLLVQGRLAGMMRVHAVAPRDWTEAEVDFTREVANRAFSAYERGEAQLALERLNARLEQLVEERTRERDRVWTVSQDLLAITDRQGVVIAVNPAWTSTLGWSSTDLVGRTTAWLEHPDDRAATQAERARLGEGGRTPTFVNRLRDMGGRYHWMSWTAAMDGERIYGVARDITAEREAAAVLRQTEDALRQAQKMEAVGQLTGGIAHDFNNLLQGILGSLEIIRKSIEAGRTERLERFIGSAVQSAKRAAGLTHRLLAFSRRQSLDLRALDVNELVHSLEDLLRRTLGENVRLHLDLEPGLWPAHSDANQLESALLNLAINARDAMPAGGRLSVRTENVVVEPVPGGMASAEGAEPGEYIMLAVGDTGVGMSPAVRERAIDPFFTTKPLGQGTGLGLSMVYGFVKQSRGHLRLDSEPGRGTTVRLYLPRAQAAVEQPQEQAAGEDVAAMPAAQSVLVVEDDPAVRMLIVEVLHRLGHQVSEAADGQAALPLLQRLRRLDLLVSDVGLPGLNGRQLAELARQAWPQLPVLFVSGYAEQAALRSGFLGDGMDLIAKPFSLDVLTAKVGAMLASPHAQGAPAAAGGTAQDRAGTVADNGARPAGAAPRAADGQAGRLPGGDNPGPIMEGRP
ncbi:MAG: PAS domain S-box protein [Pseudomonadota bacterium]